MRMHILVRAQRWFTICLLVGLVAVLFPHDLVWSYTIAEVVQNPSAFDQQTVTVEGQVADVVTRYGDAISTSFDLLDANGKKLAVFVSGIPKCKQGEICKVSGLFVAQRDILLPQTVERIAERPFESAGVLFHQKSVGGSGAGGRGLRNVYIPQE